MRKIRGVTGLLALLCVALIGIVTLQAQDTRTRRTDVFDFVNGLFVAGQTGKALSGSAQDLTIGSSTATSITETVGTTSKVVTSIGSRFVPPAAETIASAATITANACGGLKQITAAGAVTTNTTDTFTAPAAANAGCWMLVCNVGSNNITLDNNAHFKSIGGADIVLTADDCTQVVSTGASGVWYSVGSLVAN